MKSCAPCFQLSCVIDARRSELVLKLMASRRYLESEEESKERGHFLRANFSNRIHRNS